jgi:hypothetical protein
MSKNETAMTRACWRKIGGALCEEYPLVKNGKANGWRKVDGLIVLGEPTKRAPCAAYPNLKSRDIVLLQTKASRLGMSVMGQTLFSRELALALGAKSVRAIAVVKRTDAVLEPLAKKYGIEVHAVAK